VTVSGPAQRLVGHRLEPVVGNLVGLPAKPLPLRPRPGDPGPHALDDPPPFKSAMAPSTCICSRPAGSWCRSLRWKKRIVAVEQELANLAAVAATGGAVPAVMTALRDREGERQQLQGELARAEQGPVALRPTKALKSELKALLADWRATVTENTPEARRVLEAVLEDRITFRPTRTGTERGYELTVPIAWDRLIVLKVPELAGLQDRVASPTGARDTYEPGREETYELPLGGTVRKAA
jgi:hypothetical protein